MDILSELAAGTESLHDVERVYDEIMDSSDAPRVRELLGLSSEEWTAFCHGVWFDELARWRAHGWPNKCAKCGRDIEIGAYGWTARESGEQHEMIHLVCPH